MDISGHPAHTPYGVVYRCHGLVRDESGPDDNPDLASISYHSAIEDSGEKTEKENKQKDKEKWTRLILIDRLKSI